MECKREASRLWILLVLCGATLAALEAEGRAGQTLAGRLGVTRGICVVINDPRGQQALALARGSQLIVFVQNQSSAEARAACEAADAAGLYGTRIFVAKGNPKRVHLADNLADALVAPSASDVPEAEALRVLRPGGKALLGQKELTKPLPEGADDWSHHYHGPDNNPQSKDRLARAPYLTQFIVEPRYGPAPQNCVASGGRVFMAFGHVAWHQREEAAMNTLFALNGYNGTVLWTRKLTRGIMVDRATMIATPSTLYLADDESCKLIDAATGAVTGEIAPPEDLAGGRFWKWMALDKGVLYALVGAAEPRDPDARWRKARHGWPWGGISDGYNKGPYRWGFSETLFAIDPKTKKVLWHHKEQQPIDSRGTCIRNGRIYVSSFGKYLACLNATSGSIVWRRSAEKDPELFKAIGPYRPGHGYIGGWKSTVYLKCTDKALYFVGPQVNWLTALSADDGRFLWKYGAKDLQVVIRDDALYTIGAQNSKGNTKKIHPLTGKILADFPIKRRACTRSTGSPDGILFRAHGDGTTFLDLATGKPQWISPMRPACHTGVVIANGHLYWQPWTCDCNLQMFGAIACAPAGDFNFTQPARDAERLETPAGAAGPSPFPQSPADWPTYRANNSRTAVTQAAVPDKVARLWTFAPKARLEPTPPVAAGGLVLLGGSDGIVRALDAATGQPRWRAYTGGSVRYPPSLAGGRALVGSGDGWVYALDAATGRLLWRFRAAPIERKINLYGSLVSTWPVASGVLVDDGVAYCAAGINNFDGTHVYALDAATGKMKWQNNTSWRRDGGLGGGVACQGDLLLRDGKLYLAGGSSASPAAYDIASGKCINMGSRGRRGRELVSTERRGPRGQTIRQVAAVGQPLYSIPDAPVFSGEVRWAVPTVVAKNATLQCQQRDGSWRLVAKSRANKQTLWEQVLPAAPVRWAIAVDAQGRIVVALRDGRVVCFGKRA